MLQIDLPTELEARAFVDTIKADGLWEKTLVLLYSSKRRMLSTTEGFVQSRMAINHGAHRDLWLNMPTDKANPEAGWYSGYIESVQRRAATYASEEDWRQVAQMTTAVDIADLAVEIRRHGSITVAAIVTAGAGVNAMRAGVDQGEFVEGDEPKGTVNILLLTNVRLTDGAMARAIITATEAKTAAFEDLKVPSSYSPEMQATGTGTDSMIIVSGTSGCSATYTGGHSRIGEMIGSSVLSAVKQALEQHARRGTAMCPETGALSR